MTIRSLRRRLDFRFDEFTYYRRKFERTGDAYDLAAEIDHARAAWTIALRISKRDVIELLQENKIMTTHQIKAWSGVPEDETPICGIVDPADKWKTERTRHRKFVTCPDCARLATGFQTRENKS